MGAKAREIVGLNVEELLEQLNRALADEWLAFYQYWIAAQVAVGRQARPIAEALKETAMEELEHAEELATRITQLGGRLLTDPRQWFEKTNCTYVEPPQDPKDLDKIVRDTIEAERCAIEVYRKLVELTAGKDPVTYQLALHILEEELEHEDTFENLL